MKQIRVFIIDGNAAARRALAGLVNHEKDLHVCGEAGSGREALDRIREFKPDVAVLELPVADMKGIELVKEMSGGKDGKPAVLVVSMQEEGAHSAEALCAGAKGYLAKARAAEQIVDAVRTLAGGGTYAVRAQNFFSGSKGQSKDGSREK